MSAALEEEKARWRVRLREVIRDLPAGVRGEASAALRTRLLRSERWQAARSILLFSPRPDEPDVGPLREAAWEAAKRVAFPRFRPAAGVYEGAWVEPGGEGMQPGRFGIAEPGLRAERASFSELDLILVPGLGFTRDGFRLGRGRGYFDRLLAAAPGWKCGVGFDEQVLDALPVGSHDIRLDCILTPTCWWFAGRRVVAE